MAGLATTISVLDRATEPLRRMQSATDNLTRSMRSADEVTNRAFRENGAQEMEQDLLDAANAADELADSANDASDEIRNISDASDDLPGDFKNATNEAGNLKTALAGVLTVVTAIAAAGLSGGFLGESVELANQQQIVEQQLKNVLANTGAAADAFDMLKAKASQLQANSIYGDEAYIAGAAELSRALKDADAIAVMMDTLSNYAAGMSGGQALDASGMASYAEQLSRALNGTYTMLERNNFKISESQKEIIEKGTDMQKALVISDVINKSWGNLAQEMAALPNGKVTQFKNIWGDFKEEIGERLQPAIAKFTEHLEEHLPKIENLIEKGTELVINVIDVLGGLLDGAVAVYDFISENWSTIGPILTVIAVGLGACTIAMGAYEVATRLAAAAHNIWSSTASTALGHITSVTAGLAVACAAVSTFENVTWDGANGTYSALGLVMGGFATVAAVIWNVVNTVGRIILTVIEAIWKSISAVGNFLGNVFKDPVGSVVKLFVEMADTIMTIGKRIAELFDWLFGTDLASGVQSVIDDMYAYWGKKFPVAFGLDENGNKVEESPMEKLFGSKDWIDTLFAQNDSYRAKLEQWAVEGYKLGEGLTKKNPNDHGTDIDDYSEWEDRLKNLGSNDDNNNEADSILDSINTNTAKIATNTSNNDVTEILKLLREISERDTINQFTTAEIKVDIGGINNTVNSNTTAESITEQIKEKLTEELATVAASSSYGF